MAIAARKRLTLHVAQEALPLSAPFVITGYTFTEVQVIVAHLDDGDAIGEGEAAGVYYLGDDTAHMLAAAEAVRNELAMGADRDDLRRLLPPGGARNALDCALWDLEAKHTRQPAWKLAGLERPRPLVTTFTLGAGEPGMMAGKALGFAQARALKLKLTGQSALDAERVRAVRKARPDVWLGVDGNQGFVPDSLEEVMPALVAGKSSCWSSRLRAAAKPSTTDSGARSRLRRMRASRDWRISKRSSAASTSSTSSSTSAAD